MVLSFAKVLKRRNINYQNSLLVEATDVSDVCVYMTYIQLSLYGIPAVVYCGNILTNEMRFEMKTPLFYMNYWKFSSFYMKTGTEKQEELENCEDKIIVEKPTENENLYKEIAVKGMNQLSLW